MPAQRRGPLLPMYNEIEQRIIDAAQDEISRRGLTGLRVASVAEAAETSVAMIYRCFVDRTGLLEAALTNFYTKRLQRVMGFIETLLAKDEPITRDDVLAMTPPPVYEEAETVHRNVARIAVLASESTSLRIKIQWILDEYWPKYEEGVREIVRRMPPDQQFDPRIYTIFVIHQSWLLNDLRTQAKLSNEEYFSFLRDLMAATTPALDDRS